MADLETHTDSRASMSKAIVGLAGVVRRVLVYTGRDELRVAEGIEVWPLGRFFDALENGGLWP